MSVDACTRKHKTWMIFVGIVATIVVTSTTLALTNSNQASRDAAAVQKHLEVHIAAQEEHEKHTTETLHRVETGMNDILKEIRGR